MEDRALMAEELAEAKAAALDEAMRESKLTERKLRQAMCQLDEQVAAQTTTSSAANASDSMFSSEVQQLQQELRSQLPDAQGGYSQTKRPALSRMRKAELIEECVSRGLSTDGTVPILRA